MKSDRVDRRADILRVIALDGPVSRTRIAHLLGLSGSTVTAITRDLLASGLVEMSHKVQASGGRGRPKEMLTIVSEAAVVMGAKVAVDRVRGVVVDLTGQVVATFERAFDATAPSAVNDLVALLDTAHRPWPGRLVGIGLGVPGTVSAEPAGWVTSPMLSWDLVPLADLVATALGVPVMVDNDVNTLVTGQRLYGVGRGVEDFLTVTVGRGVGLGIVMDGAVRRGRGGAGELGHTRARLDGPICDCGHRGCLETRVAEPGILARARGGGLVGPDVAIAALRDLAEDDRDAARLFADAGAELGSAVADLVNLLAPRMVVVAGEGTVGWHLYAKAFDRAMAEGILRFHADIEVVVDPWDDDTWGRGAAALVLDTLFDPITLPGDPDVATRLHALASASDGPTPGVLA